MKFRLVSFLDLITDFFTKEDLVEDFLVFFVKHVDQVALWTLDWVSFFVRLMYTAQSLADLCYFDEFLAAIRTKSVLTR